MVKRYLLNWLVWMDIGFNVLTGGSVYMTFSERAWRHQWKRTIWFLDLLIGKGHCEFADEGPDELKYEVL